MNWYNNSHAHNNIARNTLLVMNIIIVLIYPTDIDEGNNKWAFDW